MKKQAMQAIAKHNMLTHGAGVVLGLSGGADSVALLHFLHTSTLDLRIVCVHINHGLRGDDARGDAEFCVDFCRQIGVEVIVFNGNAAAEATHAGIGIEEAGRRLRYSRFEEVRALYGLDVIAVAHNKNDVAETVLMQVLRGAGGLRGIAPVNGKVVRPLINVERAEIELYCSDYELEYRTDATNHDDDYTRNKIRNAVLPMLKRDFNPKTVETLARLVEISAVEDAFLDNIAKNSFDNCVICRENGISLCVDAMLQADMAIRRRVVRLALTEICGRPTNISFAHVDSVIGLCEAVSGSVITLPNGYVATKAYKTICISIPIESAPFFVDLSKDQAVFVPQTGKWFGLYTKIAKENAFTMLLDCGKIDKMQVRSRLPGDTIYFGNVGTKKIKDFFIDKKIPRNLRQAAVFVASGSDIVLIVDGYVKSDKFAPTACSSPLYLQIWDA